MIGAIWAQSLDGVIGDGRDMPWHIPEDLAHFKEITSGHPVLMGRATWESLPPAVRPLPGRRNLVVSTRAPGQWSTGAEVLPDLHTLPECDTLWVMGGGSIYQAVLDRCERVEITLIDATLAPTLGAAAVYAPALPEDFELCSDSGWRDSSGGWRYCFRSYQRTAAAIDAP
ncbi:Dihydrofolate reductase [Corynebacterium ciconiae DSM 44920]|uniref:dihydrofolate reductase n=1 Tax=Corynebacterium ciconiae TaxID=227319 RepID=UPI00036CAC87|nr:dihydrofolate reductase [Corynebacterium ciconiae]WKD61683.1 Dihydrofolate reductase [Corynebacterium ciconiae DSM 44920]